MICQEILVWFDKSILLPINPKYAINYNEVIVVKAMPSKLKSKTAYDKRLAENFAEIEGEALICGPSYKPKNKLDRISMVQKYTTAESTEWPEIRCFSHD